MSIIGHGRSDATVFTLEALDRAVPRATIERVLDRAQVRQKRTRKLPAAGVVWLLIAIGLFADRDMTSAWRQVVGTLLSVRYALAGLKLPGKSAIASARRRLGARVMRSLFRATCVPVAPPRTPGAFYRGLRLMAMDAQKLCVPDTPANDRAFGRGATTRDGEPVEAGYPQLQWLRLIETGTHVAVETIVKPGHAAECRFAGRLLDAAPADALVMGDCGYYGYRVLKHASDTGKHLLVRTGSRPILDPVRRLSDGSFIAAIHADAEHRRRGVGRLEVRVIRYTINDPDRTGDQEEHRLVTTLLDPAAFPASDLIVLYHQRWEIEIDNDEITTHQLLNRQVTLRSRTPGGCVQELYGIAIAHNAVRMLMHESSQRIDIDPRRLSFTHALRVVQEGIGLMRNARTEQLPQLYVGLLLQIAAGRLPPRENRINPRVVKVKMSKWKKKRTHHRPRQVKPFHQVIEVLK